MKKFLLLIAFLIFCFSITFSQISVKSFRILPTDQTARIINPVIDQNGEKCALIKVVTTETGFGWEGGMLGITKVEPKLGEFWVYVPHGAKKITIKHAQLGILRNYVYTEAIYEATVYEMVLTTDEVTTIVQKREIKSQWVVIITEPAGADVYLDDKHCGQTPFQQEFKEGKHTYRISKDLFHPEVGQFNLISDEGKKKMTYQLKPNYGFINIKSLPEDNAVIFVDNTDINKTTPYKTNKIKSGKHNILLSHEWYENVQKKIEVKDGESTEVVMNMNPKFAEVTINASHDADIYIDNKLEGKASISKRLMAGTYSVEVKKAMYHNIIETIEINAGEPFSKEYKLQPAFADVRIITTPEAEILIDGKFEGNGNFSKRLMAGTYSVEVKKAMYHNFTETIEITAGEPFSKEYKLQPAFGGITIKTSPESGAEVSVDGIQIGKTTPCTLEQLTSGEHLISLRREWYEPKKFRITVEDGKNQNITQELVPTFVEVAVTTNPVADIYIDMQKVGNNIYTGRVKTGIHTFQARKDKHKFDLKKEEIILDNIYNIKLSPTPKYGILKIVSEPFDAYITLNGKESGTTPKTFYDLLVGEYTIKITKEGYAPFAKTVTIIEGQTESINTLLPSGKQITVNSTPAEAKLYVDTEYKGTTPINVELSFGKHNVKLCKKYFKDKNDIIEINKSSNNINLSIDPILNEIPVMVLVRGGTFLMGGNYGDIDEKPMRKVKLNDFYIGKYEVTQKEWKAVMGNNPSFFKGDNLPVEQVSWDQVQEFINMLNQKTGKHYRLPSEAEWEYAAKGGSISNSTKYSGSNNISYIAWFWDNSGTKTHNVGIKQANDLGIYDMTGNVWEWCSDRYGSYSISSKYNPMGADSGSGRVTRGGGWNSSARNCRVVSRDKNSPSYIISYQGFRLASSLPR